MTEVKRGGVPTRQEIDPNIVDLESVYADYADWEADFAKVRELAEGSRPSGRLGKAPECCWNA